MNVPPTLKWAAYGSILLTAVVMLFPAHSLNGIDLSSHYLQTSMFAISALLFALLENTRPEMYPPSVAADDFLKIVQVRWGRHVLRVMILFLFYAGFLEIGQLFAPTRVAGFGGFAENAASVMFTSGIMYAGVRILLSNHRVRRLTLNRLQSAADSFRSETYYAGQLRDQIQEAYAISFADLPGEERVTKMAERLSETLGIATPRHHEEFLYTAFGIRRQPELRHDFQQAPDERDLPTHRP